VIAADVFDLLLALALLLAAVLAVFAPAPVRSALMFVAFGLLSAIAWVRLDAPDLALAEAAAGAGVTGVLLLDTALALRRERERAESAEQRSS
jgi:energy-converting hydrogenase B subunit D